MRADEGTAECVWPQLDDDDLDLLRGIVKGFSDASGAGPSQLLPVHLKEAMTCGSEIAETRLLRALKALVNISASGGLPLELAEFFRPIRCAPHCMRRDATSLR